MTTDVSQHRFEPFLLDRRRQVQGSSKGPVTVFVWDDWQVTEEKVVRFIWHFSFMPEPGDVLEQVDRRLPK